MKAGMDVQLSLHFLDVRAPVTGVYFFCDLVVILNEYSVEEIRDVCSQCGIEGGGNDLWRVDRHFPIYVQMVLIESVLLESYVLLQSVFCDYSSCCIVLRLSEN